MFKLIIILNLLVFVKPLYAQEKRESQFTYREKKGETVSNYNQTIIDLGDTQICTIEQGENVQQVVYSPESGTLSWDMKVDNGDLSAARVNNEIVLKGTHEGKKVSIRYDVSKVLWHQILSVSLKRLVLSDDESELFYLIRPDTLEAYKCKAAKEGSVNITLNGVEHQCSKIRIRLDGWRSFAWYVDYYFDSKTALFVKYEAKKILPGTEPVTVTLIK